MQCLGCHTENDVQRHFCAECGASLEVICLECEFVNRADAKFCGGCGIRMIPREEIQPLAISQEVSRTATLSSDVQQPDFRRKKSQAERRQLTVVFCDLVGFTAFSTILDPEDLRELIRAYQDKCTNAIERYEGIITKFMGDGVMAYFGFPQAHENDAERAVRAGLDITNAVGKLDDNLGRKYGVNLAVRVGIATGPVVVGDLIGKAASEEMAVIGQTPNLASRLESIAEPNSVVIAPGTQYLVRGLFDTKNMGKFELKGFPEPVTVWRVSDAQKIQSHFEATHEPNLSLFVSRDQEMGELSQRWAKASAGDGQLVLLGGEAGVGKSRLLHVLKENLKNEEYTSCECRCSPFYQNSAFYPIIDFIQRMLRFSKVDTPELKLARLERMLEQYAVPPGESIPVLAPLLSVPLDRRYPPLNLPPKIKKQKILDSFASLLLAFAERQPTLLIIEDLHWVDPSTLELLSILVTRSRMARMLTIFSFRPDFTPQWPTGQRIYRMTLVRLIPAEVEQLAINIAGNTALSPQVLAHIIEKTDGVPLFVEELTKLLVETGVASDFGSHEEFLNMLSDHEIPVTLRDSLMARLDKLGRAKETAQLGATLGREFSFELISRVARMSVHMLKENLARLCGSGLLYQQGEYPDQLYIFKHALVQDSAYDSLLKSKRREYHKSIVQVLEAEYIQHGELRPELLAYHFTKAALAEKAVVYWHRASLNAVERSANAEAIEHIGHGLDLITGLPETVEHMQKELELQVALGAPLIAARGYASADIEKAFVRARQLCRQLGDAPELFRVLSGLSSYHLIRANLDKAYEHETQCLEIAQAGNKEALLLQGHSWLGTILFYLSRMDEARNHLQKAVDLYDVRSHRTHGFEYGLDPAILSYVHIIWLLWLLGYPDQAMKQQRKANALVEKLDHPLSSIHLLNFEIVHHYFRGDVRLTQEKAEKQIELAGQHQFPHYVAYATILRGSALAQQHQYEAGIAEMERGLVARRDTGAELARPLFLGLLAQAYGQSGQFEYGLNLLAEATAVIKKTGERWWEPELIRLRGELLWAKGGDVKSPLSIQASNDLRQAVALSRDQGMRSLELRATSSLCRLQNQCTRSQAQEAHRYHAELFEWFKEGMETRDLKDAATLLVDMA